MIAILDLLQETTADQHVGCFADPIKVLPAFVRQMDRVNALWDAAEQNVRTDAEREHIRRSRLSTDYAELLVRWDERMANGEGEALRKDNEAFYEKIRRYGVKLKEWKHTIEPPDFSERIDHWAEE